MASIYRSPTNHCADLLYYLICLGERRKFVTIESSVSIWLKTLLFVLLKNTESYEHFRWPICWWTCIRSSSILCNCSHNQLQISCNLTLFMNFNENSVEIPTLWMKACDNVAVDWFLFHNETMWRKNGSSERMPWKLLVFGDWIKTHNILLTFGHEKKLLFYSTNWIVDISKSIYSIKFRKISSSDSLLQLVLHQDRDPWIRE